MVRSMVAGVAGLRTHQSKMDVIGNNIANVNTWGFKSYSFNFLDSMYATSMNSAGGDVTAGASGGRNPSQVGYGVTTGSISNEFGTGAPSPSSNPLDCMIDGTGFFLVGGMVSGSFTNVADAGLYLSRVGIFRVDNNGYLVDDQRSYVYGYALVDGTGIPEQPAQRASYKVTGGDVTFGMTQTTTQVEDPPGSGQMVDQPTGFYNITIAGITIETVYPGTQPEEQIQDWIKTVAGQSTFTDAAGNVYAPTNDDGAGGQIANYKSPNPFASYNIEYNNYGTPDAAGNGTVNLTVTKKQTGVDETYGDISGLFGVTPEVLAEGSTRVAGVDPQFSTELSALRIPVDPTTRAQYNIQSYKINEDGSIVGVDTQNRTITIGQIALVTVENPNGLEKTSGYYFTIGANTGDVEHTAAKGGPEGIIRGGYLEMANVDLANEFSNMITTQRGFQANSKIITVTDEMLAELVNMKR